MRRLNVVHLARHSVPCFGAHRRSPVPLVVSLALAVVAAVPAAGQTVAENSRQLLSIGSFSPSAAAGPVSPSVGSYGSDAFGGPMKPPEPSWFTVTRTRKSGDLLRQPSTSPRRSWMRRHPALFGALVGAGAGAVSAATMENELFCSGGDEDCLIHGGGRVLVGAGMGAGIGALAGWLVSLGNR